MMENNATYKVILVGDSGVGKSSLLRRYTEDDFNVSEGATVGVDFRSQKCRISDKTSVNLQIWDTAGQERYRSMAKTYFRAADVIIIIYDITCRSSFDNLKYWMEITKENSKITTIRYLVGNKLDELEFNRGEVSRDEGLNFARRHSISFVEVSAKCNIGVNEIFVDCATMLAEKAMRRHSIDEAIKFNGRLRSSFNDSLTTLDHNSTESNAKSSNCYC